jgi:hypothetical protein
VRSPCGASVLRVVVPILAALTFPFAVPAASADPVVGVDMNCVAPAGNPAPDTPEWFARDTENQYCATLRLRDQYASPAFGFGNTTQGASLWVDQATQQAGEPTHVHGGVTTLVPGSQAADPFRTLSRWTDQGLGEVTPVKFTALDGSQLRGHVFTPPATVPEPRGGYPGVVITDGSVQAYENLYYWAAEDLADSGYVVMTYDVQGQGDSDLFPANCPDPSNPSAGCPGVPYQQNYNFFQGAEDSLNFFLSTPSQPYHGVYNPDVRDLKPQPRGGRRPLARRRGGQRSRAVPQPRQGRRRVGQSERDPGLLGRHHRAEVPQREADSRAGARAHQRLPL